MSYRYTLEPYASPKSRYICPQCNDKRKTFVRYIDTQTGMHLADHVGRCSRQDKCTYHFTPKQFFEDHELQQHNQSPFEGGKGDVGSRRNRASGYTFPSFVPESDWKSTLRNYDENNFVLYLRSKLGHQQTNQLIERYHIGTSKKWPGATIFWQIDETQTCRTGKIMLYDAATGKRVKEPYSHISWVHTLKDSIKRPLFPDFKLKQCLFGAHQLSLQKRDIALVESEKTAVIYSAFYPDMLCLAAGGKEGLTKEKCATIRHRPVYVYPDSGSYGLWQEKSKELLTHYNVTNLLEGEQDGSDVADWLMRGK